MEFASASEADALRVQRTVRRALGGAIEPLVKRRVREPHERRDCGLDIRVNSLERLLAAVRFDEEIVT
jgi:hypothetical protein